MKMKMKAISKTIKKMLVQRTVRSFSSRNDELDDQEVDTILFRKKKHSQKEAFKVKDIDQTIQMKEYDEDLKEKLERMKRISNKITGQNQIQLQQQTQTQSSSSASFDQIKSQLDETRTKNEIQQIEETNLPGVKYLKYGLPIPNIDPEFKGIDEILEEERLAIKTVNENVLEMLELDENSSYQEYENSLQKYFNHEEDMYGEIIDIRKQTEQIVEQLGECAVPITTLNDQVYMNQIKRYYTINISLPGCIETENPNRFIKNLRPIEDFRNTPLIPVSDAEMRRHNEKVAEYHRSIFYFEVKKETVFNYAIFGLIVYLGATLVKLALDKQDEMGVAYQRLQLERIKYN